MKTNTGDRLLSSMPTNQHPHTKHEALSPVIKQNTTLLQKYHAQSIQISDSIKM
jgi:hypothetical protein